jgi:hypothetical protein
LYRTPKVLGSKLARNIYILSVFYKKHKIEKLVLASGQALCVLVMELISS